MDITTLENWLWEAACSIRGPLNTPKYRDCILPLLLYTRLSDIHKDELNRLSVEFGDEALAHQLAQREGARLITWDEQQRGRAAAVVETLTPTEALAALEQDG